MGRAISAETVGIHKAEVIRLENQELCRDLAKHYTDGIAFPQRRAQARMRYMEIAAALYCPRRKPVNVPTRRLHEVTNLWTHDEITLGRDLAREANDPQRSPSERKRAKGELAALSEQVDFRTRPRMVAALAAIRAPEEWTYATGSRLWKEMRTLSGGADAHYKTAANKLLCDRQRLGDSRFFSA